MRPVKYAINVTLDGCVDHRAGGTDQELHAFWTEKMAQADALLLGRVTYEMMESAWRPTAEPRGRPEWMEEFGRAIDKAKKFVVSSKLTKVDWNAELIRGDLKTAIENLKKQPGRGPLSLGGVTLPLALAEWGLIDEYEFVVHPRIAGHGPALLAGLSKFVDLKLVGQRKFESGALALKYEPNK